MYSGPSERKTDRTRMAGLLFVVLVIGLCANQFAHHGPQMVELLAVPVTAVLLVVIARVAGLSWRSMGLSREEVRAGVPYAVGAVVVVAVVVTVAVALPPTRNFFLSSRYDDAGEAVLAALIWIPLQTVLPEELIFRGVLQGTLGEILRPWPTLICGALLFGCWHVVTSLGLTAGNAGLRDILGDGVFGQVAGVLGAVIATGFAGLVLGWLRWRTTSLLAPIALHWSMNAIGAVGAAVAWQIGAA
ncbi:CPBP family intramembrane metalloprotease [Gordonia sp. ABSL1-1]|uniref:CPBP family intramembrane glutamic endopeptidase n=1 Tax=Gordonia sp. ABSL1-1 TaxID=3053923 RepID=UPI0025737165|nr:CPBP family intramembrane glutamic endopeptidase [Gordonia sp. ABSL1-1]MDL9938815.1 CPBP family intramembrane metalloprotease [Gordonia sp. ABSL1-1]